MIVCDNVSEEDIIESAKQRKYKDGDIHYNKIIKNNNHEDVNAGMVINKKTEISILREVYFACRISIRRLERIEINKDDQILINYSFFIY